MISINLDSYENYYYNDNGQIKEYILSIPNHRIDKHVFYYYADTLLAKEVLLNNNDTLLIEKYNYNDKGLKSGIKKSDFKTGKTSWIEIEYEK